MAEMVAEVESATATEAETQAAAVAQGPTAPTVAEETTDQRVAASQALGALGSEERPATAVAAPATAAAARKAQAAADLATTAAG